MSNVIPFDYQGVPVQFNLDGWINATKVAKDSGLRIDNWLRNQETEKYIEALSRHLNTSNPRDLVLTIKGRNGGTWLHPKLAVAFARWVSADFAVWCDMRIDGLLHGNLTLRQRFDQACRKLDDAKDLASMNGRELARWRNRKPALEHEVDHWRTQLQLALSFEGDAA